MKSPACAPLAVLIAKPGPARKVGIFREGRIYFWGVVVFWRLAPPGELATSLSRARFFAGDFVGVVLSPTLATVLGFVLLAGNTGFLKFEVLLARLLEVLTGVEGLDFTPIRLTVESRSFCGDETAIIASEDLIAVDSEVSGLFIGVGNTWGVSADCFVKSGRDDGILKDFF